MQEGLAMMFVRRGGAPTAHRAGLGRSGGVALVFMVVGIILPAAARIRHQCFPCLSPRQPEGHEGHPEEDPRAEEANNEPVEDPCVRLDLVDPGQLVSLLPFYVK